jgi:hypothetical protein
MDITIDTQVMMIGSDKSDVKSQEEVSKPFEDSEQARQVKEALEQVGVVFPARDEPAEIV